MATTSGLRMVSDGLTFCLDYGNPKSYDGTLNGAKNLNQVNGINVSHVNSVSVNNDGYAEFRASNTTYARADKVITSGTGPFTVGFLYRMISQGRGGLFERFGGSPYNGWSLGQGGNNSWSFGASHSGVSPGFQSVDFTFPTLNTWYYDVGTYSGAGYPTYIAYRNGEYVATHVSPFEITNLDVNPRLPLRIGNRDDVTNHNLDVKVVQIYNRVLSATEIKQNYNALKERHNI